MGQESGAESISMDQRGGETDSEGARALASLGDPGFVRNARAGLAAGD